VPHHLDEVVDVVEVGVRSNDHIHALDTEGLELLEHPALVAAAVIEDGLTFGHHNQHSVALTDVEKVQRGDTSRGGCRRRLGRGSGGSLLDSG
jgi:hypothetical protein